MPCCTKTILRVHGLHCAEEVTLLRKALEGQPGVEHLAFDLLKGRMVVEHSALIQLDAMLAAIQRAGLRAEPWSDSPAEPTLWQQHQRYVFAAASGALLLVGLFLTAVRSDQPWYAQLAHEGTAETFPVEALVMFAGSILFGFVPSLPKAWASLRAFHPDMNLLLAVSLTGAVGLGEWVEAATLGFLFALSGLLESWSLARARGAMTRLVTASPTTATVVHDHGEHVMPVDHIVVGERIRVRPGECIPCDGIIECGESEVDQAAITGETITQRKRVGDAVFAGSINGAGALEVRTTSLAHETKLARILQMLESHGQHRAASEQVIERFARVYTPVVLAMAALVPLVSGGSWEQRLYLAMMVLLIACPCALVISTPVTIASALASAARRGVLVKGGAALERVARIRAVALDKTGVVTTGRPRVKSFALLNGHSADHVLSCLHGLEQYSEHPLGQAIVEFAREQGVEACSMTDFRACAGRGAEASLPAEPFWAGGRRILERNPTIQPIVHAALAVLEQKQETTVVCGGGQEPWAVLGLQDPVRESALAAVSQLRVLGIRRIALVTGDHRGAADAAASVATITEVHADALPEDKARVVQRLREEAGLVAMVGDGLNDAPAMLAADVGIAFGPKAIDIAQQTADVIVTSPNLDRVPFLVAHGRRAVGVIRQNVALALLLKVGFVALAFFGMTSLWMAIAADTGATLLVTLNGLRLLRIPRGHLPA